MIYIFNIRQVFLEPFENNFSPFLIPKHIPLNLFWEVSEFSEKSSVIKNPV